MLMTFQFLASTPDISPWLDPKFPDSHLPGGKGMEGGSLVRLREGKCRVCHGLIHSVFHLFISIYLLAALMQFHILSDRQDRSTEC